METFACYPSSILAIMFRYQPPNDVTSLKYRAVGEARARFDAACLQIVEDLSGATDDTAIVALHVRVSMAALDYAAAINNVAPSGSHVLRLSLRAIDSVVLARMWLNKALRAADTQDRGRLVSLAQTESEKAQLLVNAGIALDEPFSVAYHGLAS